MNNILIICSIALLTLFVISAIVRILRKRKKQEEDTPASTSLTDNKNDESKPSLAERLLAVEAQECCGTHAVCEKDQIIRALRQRIDYFDDEELDDYRGTEPDAYTDEQIDEFREVLYTMRPNEIEDWLKSLELREIALPIVLKEEACILIAEERGRRNEK
jgi:hypothetical protein